MTKKTNPTPIACDFYMDTEYFRNAVRKAASNYEWRMANGPFSGNAAKDKRIAKERLSRDLKAAAVESVVRAKKKGN
jgi:hypothetical protein